MSQRVLCNDKSVKYEVMNGEREMVRDRINHSISQGGEYNKI